MFDIFPVESLARMYNDCVRSNEASAQTKCTMVAGRVGGVFMVLLNEGRVNSIHIYQIVAFEASSEFIVKRYTVTACGR